MGSLISTNRQTVPSTHHSQSPTYVTLCRPFITKFVYDILYNSNELSNYEPNVRRNLIIELVDNIYNILNHDDINAIIHNINFTIHLLNNIEFRNLHSINDIQQINNIHYVNNTGHLLHDIIIDANNMSRNENDIPTSNDENNIFQDVIFIIYNENFPDTYIPRINEMIENINNFIHNINNDRSNGVPLEIINSLREKVCSADTDDSCVICLKNYKEKDILTILFCNHSFHKECIKTWFENNNNCPICRQVLKD